MWLGRPCKWPIRFNFVSCLIEFDPAVLMKIFKSCQSHIFNLLLLSPLRKGTRSIIWKKLNPLNPRTFWANFGWNWPDGSGEVVNVFSLCSFYPPLKKGIWKNMNCLHLGMLYIKHGGTWLSDSEEVNMWVDMDGPFNRQTDRQ